MWSFGVDIFDCDGLMDTDNFSVSPKRVLPSSGEYYELNRAWNAYAQIINPQVWFNLKDIPFEFQLQARDALIARMQQLLSQD